MSVETIKFAEEVRAVTVREGDIVVVQMPILHPSRRTRLLNQMRDAANETGIRILVLDPALKVAKVEAN